MDVVFVIVVKVATLPLRYERESKSRSIYCPRYLLKRSERVD